MNTFIGKETRCDGTVLRTSPTFVTDGAAACADASQLCSNKAPSQGFLSKVPDGLGPSCEVFNPHGRQVLELAA